MIIFIRNPIGLAYWVTCIIFIPEKAILGILYIKNTKEDTILYILQDSIAALKYAGHCNIEPNM